MDKTFLRGVNLGGWLLLEKWMTPALFAGTGAIDEYTFMQTPGARKKIDQHRQTFITEEDFQWPASSGINALRIPIGYWALEGDGLYAEAKRYVDYVRLQQDVYSVTAGWFYWSYKTEKPGRWNFRSQVEAGLIDVM